MFVMCPYKDRKILHYKFEFTLDDHVETIYITTKIETILQKEIVNISNQDWIQYIPLTQKYMKLMLPI